MFSRHKWSLLDLVFLTSFTVSDIAIPFGGMSFLELSFNLNENKVWKTYSSQQISSRRNYYTFTVLCYRFMLWLSFTFQSTLNTVNIHFSCLHFFKILTSPKTTYGLSFSKAMATSKGSRSLYVAFSVYELNWCGKYLFKVKSRCQLSWQYAQ